MHLGWHLRTSQSTRRLITEGFCGCRCAKLKTPSEPGGSCLREYFPIPRPISLEGLVLPYQRGHSQCGEATDENSAVLHFGGSFLLQQGEAGL
jgi:hypothetical protein